MNKQTKTIFWIGGLGILGIILWYRYQKFTKNPLLANNPTTPEQEMYKWWNQRLNQKQEIESEGAVP